MGAQVIDGKAIAKGIRENLAQEVDSLKAQGIVPGLAVVLVGDDPASAVYVRMKQKAAQEIGLYSEQHTLPVETTESELLELIGCLNKDPKIHGILVQLPLPEHIYENHVIEAIDPAKDVDGFHPFNAGRLLTGQKGFVPCTPAGIIRLLDSCGVDLMGKRAVVVGRSNIVGKPVALLLLQRHATVTICHSRTRDLAEVCREADVLVVAVGKPGLVKGDWVKPGAVVIDVGVNRVDERLVGDVEFDTAREVASHITPVPGGVGPMTIAMLMANTVDSARNFAEKA